MKKIVLLYGLAMALLIWLLKWIDYRLLIRDISTETYVGLVAIIFTVLGIWMGLRLTNPKVVVQKAVANSFSMDEKNSISLALAKESMRFFS